MIYYNFTIVVCLLALVGASFYAGYKWAVLRVIESTLQVLQDDNIIRLVEDHNGDIEVYSGTKFYNEVEK
jgi:hypothetical protein